MAITKAIAMTIFIFIVQSGASSPISHSPLSLPLPLSPAHFATLPQLNLALPSIHYRVDIYLEFDFVFNLLIHLLRFHIISLTIYRLVVLASSTS